MLIAVVSITFAGIVPLVYALTLPSHEWLMSLSGLPALAMTIASLAVVILYVIGFIRYSASKGYSKWLGFWLLLSHLPGFIVLLLLPDLKTDLKESSTNPMPS